MENPPQDSTGMKPPVAPAAVSAENLERKKSDADDRKFFAYMKVFLVPTLVLKISILYFGIHYSSDPDVGYGWGLLISVVLSLVNFGIFIYKNWSDADDEADRERS